MYEESWPETIKLKTDKKTITIVTEQIRKCLEATGSPISVSATLMNILYNSNYGTGEWKIGKKGTFLNLPLYDATGKPYVDIIMQIKEGKVEYADFAFHGR
jgi:hypothetical protein